MNWVELVGFAGTGLTFAAWAMKGALELRIFGIASSVAFLSYGALLGSWPVMLTELVLLPLNAARLWQLLRQRGAAAEETGLDWLLRHGRRQTLRPGETVLAGGEVAGHLTLLISGRSGGFRGGPEPVLLGEAMPFARRREWRTLIAEEALEVALIDLAALEARALEAPELCIRLTRLALRQAGVAGEATPAATTLRAA